VILVLSFPNNAHVQRVLEHVKRDVTVMDTGSFSAFAGIDARLGSGKPERSLRLPDGVRVDLDDVRVVWRRRLRPLSVHADLTDSAARLFAWSETDEALQGMLHTLECPWMNTPAADEVAQRKIRQLHLAREIGLSIPETLVTDDPALAAQFVASYPPDGVITKAFRNIAEASRWTRRVTAEDLARIDSVRYAPVTFQEFVPAVLDLRVIIVEDDTFAASIRSSPGYETDYRPGLGTAIVEPYELPAAVAEGLHRLMQAFELRYGAIDMRVTPEGEHVFLEVNPGGEYLFASDRTRQPVAQAIAAALERHDRDAA
jgi:glutathione synthase/RimK-type ligase-like ATP-grasp enzyme